LNAIRAWMGSHCRCFSVGVIWSLGLRSFITRAAEPRNDESLNKNTTTCFVKTTSHLSNSVKVEKACFGRGGDMLSHVKSAVQENTEGTNHIRYCIVGQGSDSLFSCHHPVCFGGQTK